MAGCFLCSRTKFSCRLKHSAYWPSIGHGSFPKLLPGWRKILGAPYMLQAGSSHKFAPAFSSLPKHIPKIAWKSPVSFPPPSTSDINRGCFEIEQWLRRIPLPARWRSSSSPAFSSKTKTYASLAGRELEPSARSQTTPTAQASIAHRPRWFHRRTWFSSTEPM